MGLFSGEDAKGARFNDNSNVNLKILEVPAVGLSIILEGKRLRIEDRSLKNPEDSSLIEHATTIFQKLFPNNANILTGYGFNFDLYYQLRDVVRINDLFAQINPSPMPLGETLVNLGWQWTIARKDGRSFDGYFLKITAPLEVAVHHNLHQNDKKLPTTEELKKEFITAFTETHEHISSFVI